MQQWHALPLENALSTLNTAVLPTLQLQKQPSTCGSQHPVSMAERLAFLPPRDDVQLEIGAAEVRQYA